MIAEEETDSEVATLEEATKIASTAVNQAILPETARPAEDQEADLMSKFTAIFIFN